MVHPHVGSAGGRPGQDVLIVCGRQEMECEVFAKDTLAKMFISLHNFMGRQTSSEIDTTLLRLIALREGVMSNTQDRGLLALLNQVRRLNATDPRDKVHAIFGLTDSNLARMGLRPDYNIDPGQLLTNVALALLKGSTNLDVFSVPHSDSELSRQLPSWVPDWSNTTDHTRPLVPRREGGACRHNHKAFCASGVSTLPPPEVEADPETGNLRGRLKLHGYVLGQVTRLVTPFPEAEGPFDSLLRWVVLDEAPRSMFDGFGVIPQKLKEAKMKMDCARFLRPPGTTFTLQMWPGSNERYAPTGEKSAVACARTLCADYMLYKEEDVVRSFRAWVHRLQTRMHGMWCQLACVNIPLPAIQPHLIDFGGMTASG
ncbi:hypothetical protein GP486_003245 [Trichoglossum hirsutum]|uniref:Uncharacterized protein n=1 Tax=Trichoglossum hirsutum TaxID=265104 RepID=A0A9P8LDF2_9PEZI|nr:hypothetical protein GP486_003245 [Trichoglossum hirsutum]